MKEKRKKNRIVIFVILILLMVFVILSIYIICNQYLKNDVGEQYKEKPENHMEQELTKKEEETLLAQIKDYTTIFADSYPFDDNNPLDNQKALSFALVRLGVTGQDFMESDLEKQLEKYFGDGHPYIHEDIECFLQDGVLYRYDSAKREYFFQNIHGHGGYGMYPVEVFYLDGRVEDDIYTVRVNILYGDYCSGTCGPVIEYYKNAEDSIRGEYPVLGPFDDYHEVTEEEYQSIKKELPVMKFTFIKDKNENYGLQSVAIE